jgi:hypothetical protein
VNFAETGKLLAYIGAVDRRIPGDAEIMAWQELFADVENLDDALDAVREHRRTSTDWILPAHILGPVQKVRDKRLELAETTGEMFPNEVEGVRYLDEQRALRKAIASGRMGAEDLAAYHASGRSIHLHETRGIAAGTRVVRGELA